MALLLVGYFAALGALAALCLGRVSLTVGALLFRSRKAPERVDPWPPVCVQLPLYNERWVAERLLRAVGGLDYPDVTIQVLDDSTDDTRAIVDRICPELQDRGIRIEVLRRSERQGYKAGALAHGLKHSEAPLVAIFDADFVPPADFLLRTVPFLLADRSVGMVQARWGHLNRDENRLTRAQAVFLDGHFQVEHAGRHRLGHFFNFNGTAGVWRRRAIEEAGGWSSDTITEDLDLSYRAQLQGWRFVYVDDVVAPAELPADMAAFRSQQARWVRGSIETARKHVRSFLGWKGPSWGTRLDALLHLTNNFAYLLMAVVALLLPAAVVVRDQAGWRVPGGQALLSNLDLLFLGSGTFVVFAFYATGLLRVGLLRRWPDILLALALGAGMCLANAGQVLIGLGSRGSEFVRTPKSGGVSRKRTASRPGWHLWEWTLALYHGAGCVYAVYFGLWGALPFLLLYHLGFAWVGLGPIWPGLRARTASGWTRTPSMNRTSS